MRSLATQKIPKEAEPSLLVDARIVESYWSCCWYEVSEGVAAAIVNDDGILSRLIVVF